MTKSRRNGVRAVPQIPRGRVRRRHIDWASAPRTHLPHRPRPPWATVRAAPRRLRVLRGVDVGPRPEAKAARDWSDCLHDDAALHDVLRGRRTFRSRPVSPAHARSFWFSRYRQFVGIHWLGDERSFPAATNGGYNLAQTADCCRSPTQDGIGRLRSASTSRSNTRIS